MQKTLVFGQMSEILTTVIKSCCAKLWGKVISVSVNINFGAKMWFLCKKIEILGEMCALLLKVIIFLQNILFFFFFLEKSDFLREGLYALSKCQIRVKDFNFFEYINLHMCWFSLKYFICWKIVIFFQNMIFCNDISSKSVIFLVISTLHLV